MNWCEFWELPMLTCFYRDSAARSFNMNTYILTSVIILTNQLLTRSVKIITLEKILFMFNQY